MVQVRGLEDNGRPVFLLISQLVASGGAERQVLYYAEQLEQAGIPVTILAQRVDWNHVSSCVPSARIRIGGLGQLLMAGKCTAVSFLANDHATAALAKLLRPRAIRWVPFERTHPSYYWRNYRGIRGLMMNVKRNALKLAYRFLATKLICQTESAARRWSAILGRDGFGFVAVVPNYFAVPGSVALPSEGHVRPFKIAMVGRLTEIKDYPFALRVARCLLDAGFDFELHVMGSGELEAELKMQATAMGLSERVCFMGLVREAGKSLANYDLFIMTSLVEGMPNSLGEAMAVGLPCVVLDFEAGPRDLMGFNTDLGRLQIVCARDEQAFATRILTIGHSRALCRAIGAYNRHRIEVDFNRDLVSKLFVGVLKAVAV